MPKRSRKSFLHQHSLSLVTAAVLCAWIVLYCHSDPGTHWGAFFGNAIADWTGLFVTIVATKYFFEIGSVESRIPPDHWLSPVSRLFEDHSLSIFLLITGAGWIWLFAVCNPNSRWGQVVGNIVSEWTQIFGTVFLTKHLLELHSKESRR
jgi:hypothetical protein